MTPRSPDIDATGELLQGALELAIAQARREARSADAPPPPAAMRPLLRFARLPARAMRTVERVLDTDADFRARVAAAASEPDLDRASFLFLTRPEGWQAELDLIRADAEERAARELAQRAEQGAERRVAQLEAAVARLRGELDAIGLELSSATEGLAGERSARARAVRERDALAEQVATLGDERSRAVRSLKEAEAIAAERLEQIRELRERLVEAEAARDRDRPAAPDGPEGASSGVVDDAADAVRHAVAAAAALSDALTEAARTLGVAAPKPEERQPEEGPPTPAAPGPTRRGAPSPAPGRPARRTPLRLRSGVHEGTAAGLEQLLSVPGITVIVDGYNVTMQGWPTLDGPAQREALVAALGSLRARTGANLHVVFDGDAEGARPAVGAPLPVRVHFSPAEVEADDLILRMVADLPPQAPVLVVSSDGRVAKGARRRGANTVRSSVLLDLMRA